MFNITVYKTKIRGVERFYYINIVKILVTTSENKLINKGLYYQLARSLKNEIFQFSLLKKLHERNY